MKFSPWRLHPLQTPWSKKMFIEELGNPLAHCFIVKNEELREHQVLGLYVFGILEMNLNFSILLFTLSIGNWGWEKN